MTSDVPSMPHGWSLAAGGSASLAYDHAEITPGSIVLVEPSGVAHQFVPASGSAPALDWVSADGEQEAVVISDGVGNVSVHGEDGVLYTFNNLAG
jgi:hypothetical protein